MSDRYWKRLLIRYRRSWRRWRMTEYVKKSDVIKIMENNSHMIEVFGVKKKIIDGFAMGCDFEDLETVSIEEDDKED